MQDHEDDPQRNDEPDLQIFGNQESKITLN